VCGHRRNRGAHASARRSGGARQDGGRARTREVKVGTVSTHRNLPSLTNAPNGIMSTTYLAAIVRLTQFGPLLRAEAFAGYGQSPRS